MAAWIYLLSAGAMEWGWPVGLKFAWEGGKFRPLWAIAAIVCMLISGGLLFLAQREIPMGTAYAVWTGIGAVGAFVIGIIYFKEPATAIRAVGAMLIVAGIVAMKLGHAPTPSPPP